MNRPISWQLYLIVLTAAVLVRPASAQVEVRKVERDVFPGTATTVHVDLTFGSLAVEGWDGRNVQAELTVECTRENVEKCKARAHQIVLRPRMKRDTLVIKLKNTPRGRVRGLKATLRVWMPRHLDLDVNVRLGGVAVGGLSSSVEIDTVTGDVDLVHTYARVRKVDVDIGFGRADLWIPEGRVEGSGFPRKITWHGAGEALLNVNVGRGHVTVRLE